MSERTLYITEFDMERLKKLLEEEKRLNYRGRTDLQSLEAELNRAVPVASKAVPADVITMNSRVQLEDLDTGEEETCILVFPSEADIMHNKISVLAPIGTAMLGYRVGDIFEWPVPDGLRRLKVKRILYQPEASGDYHL